MHIHTHNNPNTLTRSLLPIYVYVGKMDMGLSDEEIKAIAVGWRQTTEAVHHALLQVCGVMVVWCGGGGGVCVVVVCVCVCVVCVLGWGLVTRIR